MERAGLLDPVCLWFRVVDIVTVHVLAAEVVSGGASSMHTLGLLTIMADADLAHVEGGGGRSHTQQLLFGMSASRLQ